MDELIKDEPGRFPGDGILVPAGNIASIALSRSNYSEVKPPVGTCNETHIASHNVLMIVHQGLLLISVGVEQIG